MQHSMRHSCVGYLSHQWHRRVIISSALIKRHPYEKISTSMLHSRRGPAMQLQASTHSNNGVFHNTSVRQTVIARASSSPGSRVEQWMRTPFDLLAFGPRAGLGALLSLPGRLQTLQSDMDRVTQLVQDPRPVEEKQQLVLEEVEDTLIAFLERGATVETDILANIKLLLPLDVTRQLDDLIPPLPNRQTLATVEPAELEPTIIYTADAVLENQIASEMTEIRSAVSGVRIALEDLRANTDTTKSAMLKLNLKEARDILAWRLQETAPGVARAGTGNDGSLAAATREASVLLDEVDAQFFRAAA